MNSFVSLKKCIRTAAVSLIACAVSFTAVAAYNPAEVSADPIEQNVFDGRNYSGNWSIPDKSYIVPLDDGGYMTFSVISGKNGYTVEYYDKNYNLTDSKLIGIELTRFGAFYSDSTGYYILTGQNNTDESASVECYRLTKYDKSWNRQGSCGLKDCNTYQPFEAGAASIASSGNYLVIRTCHTMYAGSDGLHHQANVTILVNTQTMKILDSYHIVMNTSTGYSSHSFNQYVKIDNNHIIGADHGDAYPRAMGVWYYKTDLTTGKLLTNGVNYYAAFAISGQTGNNYTGATLGGLEVSDSSYIIVGSSIVQGNSSSKNKNIFVTTVNKSSGSATTKWLTSDAASKGSYSNPYIVKVSSSSFAVIWSRSSTLYYAFINGSGALQGSVYSAAGSLSDCQPVLKGNRIIWYTRGNSTLFSYIDTSDKSFHCIRNITVAEQTHGKVTLSKDKAYEGEEITITATPDEGYELDLMTMNGTKLESNKFTMPAADVTLKVFFKKIGSPSIGDQVTVNDIEYKVVNSDTDGAGLVSVTGVTTPSEYVVIPNAVDINGSYYKVNRICEQAFFGDTTIRSVSIGAYVSVIDAKAFYGCTQLVKVAGGARLVSIGQMAFGGCPRLKTFSIGSAVLKKISPYAFYGDRSLKTIYIKKTTKLTKAGVKKSLKGSRIKTVKVKKSKVKKYKKIFKKSNSGRKVKVKK